MTREHAYTQSKTNLRDERFHIMTGKTFQEKNFENMINFYKSELRVIYRSRDERVGISGLSKNVRKTLKHNDITTGHGQGRSPHPGIAGDPGGLLRRDTERHL